MGRTFPEELGSLRLVQTEIFGERILRVIGGNARLGKDVCGAD